MAYNTALVERIRNVLAGRKGLTERKMFGGVAFMLRGHMCCGVLNDDLVLRLSADQCQEALAQPYVRPMDFTGRPLKGFVYVSLKGCRTDGMLKRWVSRTVDCLSTLPRKRKKGVAG